MLQKRSILHALLTKCCGPAAMAIAVLLLVGTPAWADGNGQGNNGNGQGNKGNEAGDDRAVRLLDIIPVPPIPANNNTAGALYSYDISWVDQERQLYFLADRSNKAVEVVDAKTSTLLTPVQVNPSPPFVPFAGFVACGMGDGNPPSPGANDCAGPNGVVTAEPPLPWLFVTDAGSRVDCIDITTGKTKAQVVTRAGDPTRADELAYSPALGLLFVINNVQFPGHPPYGTFISVKKSDCTLTVGPAIILDAAHGVDAQDGAEQPVWEPVSGKFYLSIPQIGMTVSHGAVVRIAPNATNVTPADIFPVEFCGPAGLTVGPKQDLFIGCNKVFDVQGGVWDPAGPVTAAPQDVIIDAKDGSLDTNVLGVGAGDEVWFNKGDGNYYATGSGSPFRPLPAATAKGATPLGVVDAKDQKVLQQLTTYNVPAGTGHPAGTAHSVAANAKNNHIFVPLAANTAFSSFAVPGGKPPAPDCETGCIAVYGHPDEDPGNPQEDD